MPIYVARVPAAPFARSYPRRFAFYLAHPIRSVPGVESPAVAANPLRVALDVSKNPFHFLGVSKVEQMESELRKLSQAELRQIREWLDDIIEDELEFTPEFERSIQEAERDMVAGKSARVREPKGS